MFFKSYNPDSTAHKESEFEEVELQEMGKSKKQQDNEIIAEGNDEVKQESKTDDIEEKKQDEKKQDGKKR